MNTAVNTSGAARMQWMDFLRGAAVLLVVVLHASFHGGAEVEAWNEANRHLTPFRMPLLMLLSGMLLHRSLTKPVPNYLWGKVAAIVWPFALWLMLYGFLVRGGVGMPSNGVDYWLTGDYLWFLMSLTACYLLAVVLRPLARRFPRGNVWAFLAFFAGMISVYVTTGIAGGLLGSTIWYGSFFFLGAWASRFAQRWVSVHWAAVIPLLAAAAFFAHLGVEDRSLRVGTFEAAGISVLGIAVILWIAPRLPRGFPVRFVAWVGRSSIVVYVAHFPIIIFARDTFFARLELSPSVQVMLMTMVALGGSVLLVGLRPWTPWLYVFPGHRRIAAQLAARPQNRRPAPSPVSAKPTRAD